MIAAARDRITKPPPEGWLSLLLVAILAVDVAWSLDDAALVLGRREWTDFLAWAALGGVVVGFIGARAGWNRPVAHLVGGGFAALVVPLMVGSVLAPGASLSAQYQATSDSVVNAFIDFAILGLQLTRESGHYLLTLGLLCWANGQFAASAVFRHGRPIGPIIVLGSVLVANMTATSHEYQIWFLVVFSMAALFLLTRLHAMEERATWIRRRIGDPTVVGQLYLRGGTVFILVAVFLALTLTATARSAPLAGFWDDAKPALVEISQWLQRLIPPAPDSKSLGVPAFGAQVTIGGIWSTADTPALKIVRAPGDDEKLYWRATTYDTFTLNGWTTGIQASQPRPANTPLLGGTLDATPVTALRSPRTFQITPLTSLFHIAFSPIDPLSINRESTLRTSGADGTFQSVGIEGRDPYMLTASIPQVVDQPGGLTINRLRAAGTSYPPGITARYLAVPNGAMGPQATQLLADIMARVKASGRTTPYDVAAAMVDEFHNPNKYSYRVNVLGVCDRDPSIVECFAAHKQGYCEHYASTMVIFLRQQKIPARLVEGFLPGDLDVASGVEQIRTDGAHAWVEAFFPGIGWYAFDPTGGGRADTPDLPEGTIVPVATPTPVPSFGSIAPNPLGEDRSTRPGGTPLPSRNGTNTPGLILVAVLLLVAILLLGFIAWRRGPRSASTPEGVYASIAGLARRLGFGPRPTETAYEYATALGDLLPRVRPELQTVAAAKVEVAYGRRQLGEDRLKALRASYRRLRVGLLRLAFRRRERRRRR
jgi:transglutaminase-like putative cysteine protease